MTKIYFIHIPKAAGTSFRQTMEEQLGADQVLWLGMNGVNIEAFVEPSPENFSKAVVGGHMPFSRASRTYRDGYRFFATLREPVSRVISLHNYIANEPSHHLHAQINSMSFLEAIERVKPFEQQAKNFQCHYLSASGQRTYGAAVSSILTHDILVNVMGQNDMLVSKAQDILGLDAVPEMKRSNQAAKSGERNPEYDDEDVLAAIRDLNQEDIRLYDTLSALYQKAHNPSFDVLKSLPNPLAGLSQGQTLVFKADARDSQYLDQGWSNPGPDGVWSEGHYSIANLPLKTFSISKLKIKMAGFARKKQFSQRVKVMFCDQPIGELELKDEKTRSHVFRLPAPSTLQNTSPERATLTFQLPDAVFASEKFGVPDERKLAIRLDSIKLI